MNEWEGKKVIEITHKKSHEKQEWGGKKLNWNRLPHGISLTIFRHHSHRRRRGALWFIQMWNKNCVILFMHILRICDSSTCCKWVNTHWENYDEFLSMAMQTRQYAPFSWMRHVWNFSIIFVKNCSGT